VFFFKPGASALVKRIGVWYNILYLFSIEVSHMPMISLLKADTVFSSSPQGADLLIRRLLLPLGGGEFYFCPGEKLAILADVSLPADNETGANFDIRLAWALINMAKDEGIRDIALCIRPEEGFDLETVLAKTSYGKLATIEGLQIIGLNSAPATPRRTDTALILEEAEIYDVLAAADIIISLAKFKTADARLFGGAMTNITYAAKPASSLSFELKQRALVDIYSILAPDLTIVDCIRGQSGFQNNRTDCLLAGSDAVALDTVLCAIADIGLHPNSTEAVVLGAQYGLGVSNPADIAMFGDDLREIMAAQ
jgi:uncharacterized protein (DUF362 family)